jgi:hypothetical protein
VPRPAGIQGKRSFIRIGSILRNGGIRECGCRRRNTIPYAALRGRSLPVAFANAALTAAAILLDDLQSRLYRKRDLARILARSRRSSSSSTGPSSSGRA